MLKKRIIYKNIFNTKTTIDKNRNLLLLTLCFIINYPNIRVENGTDMCFSWLYTTMCFHIDYNGFLVRWFMFEKTKEWAIISQIVSSHLERRLRGNIIRMYRRDVFSLDVFFFNLTFSLMRIVQSRKLGPRTPLVLWFLYF